MVDFFVWNTSKVCPTSYFYEHIFFLSHKTQKPLQAQALLWLHDVVTFDVSIFQLRNSTWCWYSSPFPFQLNDNNSGRNKSGVKLFTSRCGQQVWLTTLYVLRLICITAKVLKDGLSMVHWILGLANGAGRDWGWTQWKCFEFWLRVSFTPNLTPYTWTYGHTGKDGLATHQRCIATQ